MCVTARVMEVWPSGVALQGEAPNHRRLRRLRAGVVSAAEKGGYASLVWPTWGRLDDLKWPHPQPNGFARLAGACDADPGVSMVASGQTSYRAAMIMAAKGGTLFAPDDCLR